MQFLKNLGTAGFGAVKANAPPEKTKYFASLKLQQKQKPSSNKQNSKSKKLGPPKNFVPEKFALDFDNPSIILQYRDPESDKLYHHKMKLKKLKRETSTKQALDYLKKKHYHYFIPKIIDEQQIQKLIEKLKNGLVGKNQSAIESVNQQDFDFDYGEDFQD